MSREKRYFDKKEEEINEREKQNKLCDRFVVDCLSFAVCDQMLSPSLASRDEHTLQLPVSRYCRPTVPPLA